MCVYHVQVFLQEMSVIFLGIVSNLKASRNMEHPPSMHVAVAQALSSLQSLLTSPKKRNGVCFHLSGRIDSKDKEGTEAEEKKPKVS